MPTASTNWANNPPGAHYGRGSVTPRYKLNEAYVEAIVDGGGDPYLLPHLDPTSAASLLEPADGLLVSGGEADVPPAFYGATPSPLLGAVRLQRSAFERALIEAALAAKLPVLGVCGGMQILNVTLGGSLYQDLRERPGTSEHQQEKCKDEPSHSVQVTRGSLLAGLCDALELEVNSTHHQVVRELGRGLVTSGTAPDGVIEAIELAGAPFVLGVQWHPESLRAAAHRAIYGGLVHAAGQSRPRRA